MTSHKGMVRQAAEYLAEQGFTVIDQDWKGTDAVLDIVASENRHELVVVVVQARITPVSTPRGRRLRRAAVAWMHAHGTRYDRVRVDVVSVRMLHAGQSNLEHMRAADDGLY